MTVQQNRYTTRPDFFVHRSPKGSLLSLFVSAFFRCYVTRQDVAWGGFNVVQATLNAVELALAREIPFNWLWILSGTTYPIASNDDIRAKFASHHPESVRTVKYPVGVYMSRAFGGTKNRWQLKPRMLM